MYSSFSVAIYVLIWAALYLGLKYLKVALPSIEPSTEPPMVMEVLEEEKQTLFEREIIGIYAKVRTWYQKEFKLFYAAVPLQYNLKEKRLKSLVVSTGIILGWRADCVILAQYIAGTVILSNVLFVRLDDAI